MPGFSTFGSTLVYRHNSSLEFSLQVKNLFNSTGIMNFFGPNEFGSSANQATEEYIRDHPGGTFVVFPVGGRGVYFGDGGEVVM